MTTQEEAEVSLEIEADAAAAGWGPRAPDDEVCEHGHSCPKGPRDKIFINLFMFSNALQSNVT